jgi:hypothetical protein
VAHGRAGPGRTGPGRPGGRTGPTLTVHTGRTRPRFGRVRRRCLAGAGGPPGSASHRMGRAARDPVAELGGSTRP